MYTVIRFFGYSVQSYYLCAALAGIIGIVASAVSLKKEFSDIRRVLFPTMLAVLAVVSARLMNYATNPTAYGTGFPVWKLRYTKLSLMGGLIVGTIAVFVIGLITKRDPLRLLDCVTFPAALGIVLLKLGCFLNGCCFGKPTDCIFGVVFPANASKYRFLESIPLFKETSPCVHPTQMYELFGAVVSLIIALLFERKLHAKSGVCFFTFAACFSIARLIVLPLRVLPYSDIVKHIFYPALYGTIIIVSIAAIIFRIRHNKDDSG